VGYDTSFYDRYEAYLNEPRVREKHDRFFDLWGAVHDGEAVVDLGCGRSQEYLNHAAGWHYTGFDQNAVEHKGEHETIVAADYRAPDFIARVLKLEFPPTAFVSLFSAEITALPSENKALYERMFLEVESIERALVAGFYYIDRRDENPVIETGGVASFQTLNNLEHDRSEVYDEIRMLSAVPSKMFGEQVVEVWRILMRRR